MPTPGYSIRHKTLRGADVYDHKGAVLRVGADGYIHGITREQASELVAGGYLMDQGAGLFKFESRAIAAWKAYQASLVAAEALKEAADAAIEDGVTLADLDDVIQRVAPGLPPAVTLVSDEVLPAEKEQRQTPPQKETGDPPYIYNWPSTDPKDVDDSKPTVHVVESGPPTPMNPVGADWVADPIHTPDPVSSSPAPAVEDDEPEFRGALTNEDMANAVDAGDELVDPRTKNPDDEPKEEPVEIKGVDPADLMSGHPDLWSDFSARPWRARLKIAKQLGANEKGEGAVGRAMEFLRTQSIGAIQVATDELTTKG